jgi:hypothetical protein
MLSSMAKRLEKRRFQRLFVVLTACWILFCLFVQPILMARQGLTHYQKDVQFCYEDRERQSNLQTCLAHAEDELRRGLYAGFGVEYDKGHSWSYGWYLRGDVAILSGKDHRASCLDIRVYLDLSERFHLDLAWIEGECLATIVRDADLTHYRVWTYTPIRFIRYIGD